MTPVPSVRFVGHDASLTGAPTVLRSLVAWVASNGLANSEVVLLSDGPLLGSYSAVAPTQVLNRWWAPAGSMSRAARRLGLTRVGHSVDVLAATAVTKRIVRSTATGNNGSDRIWYANSLAALPATRALARREGASLICHVHELDHVADRILGSGAERARLLASVDRFVAASEPVAEMLIQRFRIAPACVTAVDEFIEPPKPLNVNTHRQDLMTLRTWGIDPDRPMVLGLGALGPRKGIDHFVELVAALRTHPARPIGVWAGAPVSPAHAEETAVDIASAGLSGDCIALGTVTDPSPLLRHAQLLVSPAREDPLPLAVLEAGAHGTPVVGFDSGGLSRLCKLAGLDDMVVSYGDVVELARRCWTLLDDVDLAKRLGAQLRVRVEAHHFTAHQAPLIWSVIKRVIE